MEEIKQDEKKLEVHTSFENEKNRQVRIEAELSKALDSARVRPNVERAEAIRKLQEELGKNPDIRLTLSDDNKLFAYVEGQRVGLTPLLEDTLLRSDLADRDSIAESIQSGEESVTIRAKTDLRTAKEKTAFIGMRGYDAWESLPLERTSPPPKVVKAMADVKTTKDKIEFIKTFGFDAWAKLPVK
jgi:hypothetical protein